MHLTNGTSLQGGKYKIVRFLSNGGFGNTYEGVHTMMDTRVAIKEFFPKMFCNRDENTSHVTVATQGNRELVDKLRKKFNEEAKAVFQMKHDNIVRVLDIFEENGTAYYVMEYIDGKSLNEITKERGALPESEAVGYIRQVADALKYVHSLNRLHLDIKPGNIMVDKNGKAILIDFGASKHYDDESGENTSTLMGVNTKGYAPVEQMSRSFSDFNPSADVYALGATLYKLLTNITPKDSVLLMTGDEELSPLPSFISDNIKNAVEHAMIPQRKRRTQTIAEFINEISRPNPRRQPEGCLTEDVDEITVVDMGDILKQEPAKSKLEDLTFNVDGVSFKMIAVEGGTFKMGCNDSDADYDEKPIHNVTLSSYYIGETQVVQALWKAVMGNNLSHFEGDNLPVVNVSWNDCQKFISKLNSMTGLNFRLPTEAQWEYAARGGRKSKGYKYSGSNNIDEVAWYENNSHTRTGWFGSKKDQQPHPVATKQPNELGLYDMSGNVLEWCSDWYGNYSSSSLANPTGPNSGSGRVHRGGSWSGIARFCRSSHRGLRTPDYSFSNLGLRLVLVP